MVLENARAYGQLFWSRIKLGMPSRCELFGFVLIVITCVYLTRFFSDPLEEDPFWESDKCPACYGTESCKLLKNNIHFDQFYIWNFLNAKNVFYGNLKGEKVVAKKLAHTTKFIQFDQLIRDKLCKGTSEECDDELGKVWQKYVDKQYSLYNMDPIKTLGSILYEVKLLLESLGFETAIISCLSQVFLNLVVNVTNSISTVAFTLLLNPEPLLQQILADRWLPRWYGVCGRLVAQEYVGPTLSDYHMSPLETRLKLAASLLEMADEFTYHNKTGLAYYLTDVSFDNFAVKDDTTVKLIDAESIIVVDPALNPPLTYHANDFDKVSPGDIHLGYSVDDLCTASYADHNYYAICKCILSRKPCSTQFPGGLLWGSPNHIKELVESCVEGHDYRNATSHKLLSSIRKLIQ